MRWPWGNSRQCFCAFCRHQRRVYTKRHLSWTDVGLTAFLITLAGYLTWRAFDPRAVLVFVGALMLGEIMIQLRWRLGMPCPHCGFDPILYKRSPDLAAAKVRTFYDKRKLSADFYLTGNALIETQRRMREAARARRKVELKRPSLAKKMAKPNAGPARGEVPRQAGRLLSKNV